MTQANATEKYTLNKTELKNGEFLYTVTNEAGEIISKRKSSRDYVACTINGLFYFGRLDLIGKGEHANHIKQCEGYRMDYDPKANRGRGGRVWKLDPSATKREPLPIAYLKK